MLVAVAVAVAVVMVMHRRHPCSRFEMLDRRVEQHVDMLVGE